MTFFFSYKNVFTPFETVRCTALSVPAVSILQHHLFSTVSVTGVSVSYTAVL
jgi:Na+-translocating ferredoxin:NAD+ oxidoreductase RnfA subunit